MRWLNVGKDKEVVYNLSKAQSALSKIPANKEILSCRHTLVGCMLQYSYSKNVTGIPTQPLNALIIM